MIWIHPDNIESGEKMSVSAILKFATASGKLLIHQIAGLSLGFMSSYCANEGIFAFQYGGNVLFP